MITAFFFIVIFSLHVYFAYVYSLFEVWREQQLLFSFYLFSGASLLRRRCEREMKRVLN